MATPTISTVIQDLSTGAGFYASLKRADVFQILDQTTNLQVFAAARPLHATVKETSKGLKYPIETGATLTDSIIVEPTEIDIDFRIPQSAYSTVYPQIRNARLNGTLFIVQTRVGTYRNMYIEQMPHDETADMTNAILMSVKFVEALQVAAYAGTTTLVNNYAPNAPAYQNTTLQGLLSGLNVTSSALSGFSAASVVGL